MKPSELRGQLRKTLSPVYLLRGPEALLREEAEQAIRSHARECEEVILWAGEGTTLREAVEEARTRPLFAPRKLVVFREADDELKRSTNVLKSYLRSPTDFSTLVVECEGGKGGFKGAVVVECLRLYETEYGRPGISAASPLGRWLRTRASKARVELSSEATVGLIEAVGSGLKELASAVELAAANLKGGRVGPAEIEELFPHSRTSAAGRLVDGLLDGKAFAMELAREALDRGIEFSGGKVVRGQGAVAAVLIVVLAREIEKLQLACAMIEEGTPERAAAKHLGVPRHREDAFLARAKRGSASLCALALEALLEAETGFKTGAVEPRLALLSAVAKIGEIWKDVRAGVR